MKQYFYTFLAVFLVSQLSFAGSIEFKFKDSKLDNDSKIFFIDSKIPTLQYQFLFHFGQKNMDASKIGQLSLLSEMLFKESKTQRSGALSAWVDQHALNASMSFDGDAVIVSFFSLKRKQNELFKFMKMVFNESHFSDEQFLRIKKNRLNQINQIQDYPSKLSEYYTKTLKYGNGAYSAPSIGYLSSIEATKKSDISTLFNKVKSSPLTVSVVADYKLSERKDAKEFLSSIFLKQTKKQKANGFRPVLVAKKKAITKSGLKQSEVIFSLPGIRRGHPDYWPLRVAINAFGGSGLESILNREMREKRGLTYGVYGFHNYNKNGGTYDFKVSTRHEVALKAHDIFLSLFDGFVGGSISAEDFERAKQGVLSQFAFLSETPKGIGSNVLWYDFFNIPPKQISDQIKIIENLTINDIKNAVKKNWKKQQLKSFILTDDKQSVALKKKGFSVDKFSQSIFK